MDLQNIPSIFCSHLFSSQDLAYPARKIYTPMDQKYFLWDDQRRGLIRRDKKNSINCAREEFSESLVFYSYATAYLKRDSSLLSFSQQSEWYLHMPAVRDGYHR